MRAQAGRSQGRLSDSALNFRLRFVGGDKRTHIPTYSAMLSRLRARQRAAVVPLWGPTESPNVSAAADVRGMHGLPVDRRIAIFGGQIAEGRGIDEIIEAAKLAAAARPDLYFLLVGRGRLEGLVQAYIDSGGNNLALRPSIPREDYLSLVSACDVGISAVKGAVSQFITGVPRGAEDLFTLARNLRIGDEPTL